MASNNIRDDLYKQRHTKSRTEGCGTRNESDLYPYNPSDSAIAV